MSSMSKEMLDKKLELIYDFLTRNRKYNLELQNKYIEASLSPFTNKRERAYSLLHHAYYSQSRPKLDHAEIFFKEISEKMDVLDSFKAFCEYLDNGRYAEERPYESLFKALKKRKGWGNKTAALFTKKVYNIHHSNKKLKKYKFWTDTPILYEADKLYLPVDKVIENIFNRIGKSKKLTNFDRINAYLFKSNKWDEMDLWDDLWFWGFITQKVIKESYNEIDQLENSASKKNKAERKFEFNPGKYWLLLHAPKSPEKINEIKNKCDEFINLIRG